MGDNPFRRLPAVKQILDTPLLRNLQPPVAPTLLTEAVRAELAELRQQIGAGSTTSTTPEEIAALVVQRLRREETPKLRTVINATGIVLHTNLGRAPMATQAVQAAANAAGAYLNLELDLQTGQRSSRQQPLREILCPLLKCEAATAVNNCAAATVIVLRALAAGKEVIVSRGQLVEIGGSFRIPEIMAVSGAILREVGTTNITRISDYEKAIGPNTGLLLRVHHSNYRISGFTETTSLAELVELGKRHNLPVVDDVGSGALLDFATFGLPGDPVVPESLTTGADLVLFSGDKLLGGPQAGVIVGKKNLIEKIERDPLMRAFRLDKMTLAALEATLRLYRDPAQACREIPILKMLSQPLEVLRERATRLAAKLRMLATLHTVELVETAAYVGGGSLPDLPLPTVVVSLTATNLSAQAFAERLRVGTPAVLTYLRADKVQLDPRTIFVEQEEALLQALAAASAC